MSEEIKPLWPVPIEVFGITGEHETGKTTFAVTACPGEETLVYDFEKSSKSYERDLGFVRVDVPDEMQAKYGGKAKPIDVFNWWVAHVRSIPKGQYRVIVVDPASDIEQGLADYVAKNPALFGRTMGQYAKMSGLMWGDMKALWKTILADIAARCETFFFVVHMSTVYKGDKPSKERKAKGKVTLFELASVYLRMERNKDKSVKPSAVVLKTRLSKMVVNHETGEVDVKPILPPRIPIATPHSIRQYCLKPADSDNLKPEEHIGEVNLTDDERLMLRADIAEAERDAEQFKLEREGHQEKRLGGVSTRPAKLSASRSDQDASADSTQVPDDDATEEAATEEATTDEASTDEETTAEEAAGESTVEAEGDTADEASSASDEEPVSVKEALVQANASPPPPSRYASPDAPVGKGQLAMLNNAIARYLTKFPEKQENITKGIKKRNHRATSPADLTNGQAEDMEASLLKILNGPHESPSPSPAPEPPAKQEVAAKKAAPKR